MCTRCLVSEYTRLGGLSLDRVGNHVQKPGLHATGSSTASSSCCTDSHSNTDNTALSQLQKPTCEDVNGDGTTGDKFSCDEAQGFIFNMEAAEAVNPSTTVCCVVGRKRSKP